MSRRRTISVQDYPEHLNPFSETHQPQLHYEPEPFKFHTVGRRPKRRPSLSNAWNLFASRKTKPVEASLNLSPRLPRSSSLADNELQEPQEPPQPTRRKLFADFSWLPGRRRFGSVSQQSSPSTPRRNKSAYPGDATMQRYRSISLSRTSENTVYRPGETPLITPRTYRYRAPPLNPSENDPYKTISGYPATNGGEYYYSAEQRNRLSNDETPRRVRSSSLSPTANGDPYNTRLYIDELRARTSVQGLERLHIDEPGDRHKSSVSRRLYQEDSPSKTPNGDSRYTEKLYIDESSVSPMSNGGRQSPAVTPSSERSSPFDERLVPQRPPRPPRTKKRRAPLPPLPQFAQKAAVPPNTSELNTTDPSPQPNDSEEKSNVSENQVNDSEEQQKVTEHQLEVTELQMEVTEPVAVDKQTVTSEQHSPAVELPTITSEQQLSIEEQPTNSSEQLMSVAELQTSISKLLSNVSELQYEHDIVTNKEMETTTPANTDTGDEKPTPDKPQENNDNVDEKPTPDKPQEDNDNVDENNPSEEEQELRKPETKVRTKFGICDTP